MGEERIRVARDLHDGVLQSLTGAALKLESVRKLVGSEDGEAQRTGNVTERAQPCREALQRRAPLFLPPP